MKNFGLPIPIHDMTYSTDFVYKRVGSVGSVSKSSSISSNECLHNSFTESLLGEETRSEPKLGLKLVFKRQSHNNYVIKQEDDENNNYLATAAVGMVANCGGQQQRARPKREAARKVKFVFSDNEDTFNMAESPVKRKRQRMCPSSKLPVFTETRYANLDDEDDLFSNYSQQLLKQPQLFTHFQQQQAVKPRPVAKVKPIQKPKPIVIPKVVYKEFKCETMENKPFLESEIVKITAEEAVFIMNNQPTTVLNHSLPLHIALVEDQTNIVCTKAVLFIHLFKSFDSPCIGCPPCKSFLTTTEFSKHIHPDEDEEGDDDDEQLHKKSYKILPYNQDKLSESDLSTWKLFGKRFGLFKQRKQQKLVPVEVKPAANLLNTNFSNKKAVVAENNKLKKIEFDDWDYKENQTFLLDQERFDSDQLIVVESPNRNNQVHYFYEQEENLVLSEDEDDTAKAKKNKIIENNDSVQVVEEQIIDLQPLVKPTLTERYFNMYNNLSKDTLLFICDNEFTIIPSSFIQYINNKRELNMKQLKLAETSYHQTKWLQLSLDLECSTNRPNSSRKKSNHC